MNGARLWRLDHEFFRAVCFERLFGGVGFCWFIRFDCELQFKIVKENAQTGVGYQAEYKTEPQPARIPGVGDVHRP